MANLGTSFLHVVEEVASSSIGSVNHLPYVFASGHSKTAESSGGALITVVTESKTGSSDPNQTMTSEWLSASAVARPDNMFGKSYGHRFSDPMATSISCDSPLGGKVTSYYKKFLHVFLYVRENRPDIVQELLSRGHSATVVSDPSAMKRYLAIGMNIFDVVFIEWSEMLITPQIRDLITTDAGKQTTMLYLLNEDTYTLPLPPATPDEAVLRIHDIGEVLTNPAVGMNVSMYIRQRRLRREMFQIRWRKSYQIVRQIGGGAFGDVYEVYLLASRGRLAMKRLFLNGASNRVLEQLNREVLIMSQLDHPNIVTFSHSSMEDNAYCIFMELCDVTLGQRLQQHSLQSSQHQQHQHHPQQQQKKITEEKEKGEQQQQQQQQQQQHEHIPLTRLSKTPHYHIQVVEKVNNRLDTNPDGSNKYPESLTAREIVLILRDIANGIAYIHAQGIVHRDLKPQNILFSNGVAKIGDFGSAAEENTTKPLVNMKGTLAYMSPEVLLGEPYGRPCDMWSFGCLLAEIIGLRLGHLQGLHLPALIELYKSIPPNGTLPITIGNYKGGKLQHHFGASTAQMILGAMKSAYNDSSTKHVDSPPSLRFRLASLTLKDQPLLSNHHEVTDNRFQNSMNSESARAVAYITTNSTSFLGSEKAELPESLVELLEGLFRRDPARRMTAEEVLQHPVTWDVEWMEMVLRAVEEISALDTEDATVDTSQGTETNAENGENFNLSIDSV